MKKLLLDHSSEVLPEHRRELLTVLLWKITEADGKWMTRYRTKAAIECADPRRLRHEHVYQRAKMIDALLSVEEEDEVEKILGLATGCIVTVDEHLRLASFDGAYGWERYRLAGIQVVDMMTMQAKIF